MLLHVTNCYCAGTIDLTVANYGGFVPNIDASDMINSCYFDSDVAGTTATAAGTARQTLPMKLQSNYVGWNFDSIWNIIPGVNDGYPMFEWQNINIKFYEIGERSEGQNLYEVYVETIHAQTAIEIYASVDKSNWRYISKGKSDADNIFTDTFRSAYKVVSVDGASVIEISSP